MYVKSVPNDYAPHLFRNNRALNKLLKRRVLINLTRIQLSPEQIEGLCLGLSFVTTADPLDIDAAWLASVNRWKRSLNCKLHFAAERRENDEQHGHHLDANGERRARRARAKDTTQPPPRKGWLAHHIKSEWQPPRQDWEDVAELDALLTELAAPPAKQTPDADANGNGNGNGKAKEKDYQRLTPLPIREGLRALSRDHDLHICKSDKSRNVVLWYASDYDREAARQLTDRSSYTELSHDDYLASVRKIARERDSIADDLYESGRITARERAAMTGVEPAGAPIYYLPKVHKPKNAASGTMAGRPIVATFRATNCVLDKLITVITALLLARIPGSLVDTKDFLRRLLVLGVLPAAAKLVTADVNSLYPTIPWEEGIEAATLFYHACRHLLVAYALQNGLLPPPTTEQFNRALRLVLTNSIITFKGRRFFRQETGTAMGMCVSVYFANTFMYYRTKHIIDNPPQGLLLFLRYIDDIFYVFADENPQLLRQITASFSDEHISLLNSEFDDAQNYLDVLVRIDKKTNTLQTSTYWKETASGSFVHPASNHPPHTTDSIPVSQFARLRRNASSDELFEADAKKLCRTFTLSGYSYKRVVAPALQRARASPPGLAAVVASPPTPVPSGADPKTNNTTTNDDNNKKEEEKAAGKIGRGSRLICRFTRTRHWPTQRRKLTNLHAGIVDFYAAAAAARPTTDNERRLAAAQAAEPALVHSVQQPINALFSTRMKHGDSRRQ